MYVTPAHFGQLWIILDGHFVKNEGCSNFTNVAKALIQILPTGDVGFIRCSVTEAFVSYSTVGGTFKVCCENYVSSIMHAVTAAYPQSISKSTPACSSLRGTVSYETYVANQEESGCVVHVCNHFA